MRKVHIVAQMVIHDDRTQLTTKQAFDILWEGHAVRISHPPDFSEDEEYAMYDIECPVFITDIIDRDELDKQTKDKSEEQVHTFLQGYEIYG